MIIVKLQGGLGNQLFQYAFARAVSTRLKTDFKLDQKPFHTYYKLHKYSLDHFNVIDNPAKNYDMFGFVWLRSKNSAFDWFYSVLRLKRKIMPFYYPEQRFDFDPEVFKRNNVYYDGFWQTEKYFKDIADDLRKEIVIKKDLSDYSHGILNEIKKTNAVSIHVRRADYISDAATNNLHGTCSLEYYQSAIEYIEKHVDNPHYFIFSDDYNWAIDNFKFLKNPFTCISNGADKNYEDLTLMSKCKHHIIANSSFSWWGAWLNPDKNKIVVGPARWFNSVKKSVNTRDVMPDTWIKV